MNKWVNILSILMLILSGCVSLDNMADEREFNAGKHYSYGNGMVTYSVDNQLIDSEVDSLLSIHGLSLLETDSLMRYSEDRISRSGWTLMAFDDLIISYAKPLSQFGDNTESFGSEVIIAQQLELVDRKALDVPYGVNKGFTGPDPGIDSTTKLTYQGTGREEFVYLSGTFNNWSTLSHPLQFRGDSWEIELDLEPGKHLYRFVVDGKWTLDPRNNSQQEDTRGYMTNVLYVYNHLFTLDGFLNAENVSLQGSFNDWRENELIMRQQGSSWTLPMYLRIGTHAYKFKVDGRWELDPNNPIVRTDDAGFENSFMSIGDTIHFSLKGYTDAQLVYLSGDFNAWQRSELRMERTDDGWTLPYVLRPGNYEYKFIVDGIWIHDKDNPHSSGTGDFINSIRSIEPNHQFRLKGFSDADEVSITGDFFDWSEDGYRMIHDGEDWVIDLFLPKGKTSYKFLVDGEWTKDPDNPLWEKNEFGTYNSIIWKD